MCPQMRLNDSRRHSRLTYAPGEMFPQRSGYAASHRPTLPYRGRQVLRSTVAKVALQSLNPGRLGPVFWSWAGGRLTASWADARLLCQFESNTRYDENGDADHCCRENDCGWQTHSGPLSSLTVLPASAKPGFAEHGLPSRSPTRCRKAGA